MYDRLGYSRIEDFHGWDRVRIFFVQTRWREKRGDIVYLYKIYKHRKVLIRTLDYTDRDY